MAASSRDWTVSAADNETAFVFVLCKIYQPIPRQIIFYTSFYVCNLFTHFFLTKQLSYRVSQSSRVPSSERCRGSLQWFKYENSKKNRDSPHKDRHWSEGALFELRFLQIQAEKFSVYCYLWCR
jgi:hypothetical protein